MCATSTSTSPPISFHLHFQPNISPHQQERERERERERPSQIKQVHLMITLKVLYNVLSAVIPLYVTMFLAYASVRWWKIFTADQCAGINRFVAAFAVPFLSFEFISRVNPFKMNFPFIAADALSKALPLLCLFSFAAFSRKGSLDWSITLFSLSTLPNTLVMGIPLLKSMYGSNQEGLMIQVVVLQSIIWYTLLLFLFEYRGARNLVLEKSNEESAIGPKAECEEMVRVIEQKRVQMGCKVAPDSVAPDSVMPDTVVPDSVEVRLEEGEECGKELHVFVNSGGLCENSVKVCSGGEQKETAGEKQRTERSGAGFIVIMKMVGFKLVRNPNSYASLLGLGWSLASNKWGLEMPIMIKNSVEILSNAGLGMSMFSLGLFMALQPRIIACGKRLAAIGMLVRFVVGPALMALASYAVGIRGTIFKVSIVQAALPQAIVPFVFAREYNLHPEVLSTAVIFGMIVSLPVTILYYVLLGL